MMSRSCTTSTSSASSLPPGPSYILRTHAAPVSVLHFTDCGRFLLSGDTDGFVALWHLMTFRPRFVWKAHDGGLLGVREWGSGALTQGRDNLIRYFPLPPASASTTSPSAALPTSPSTAVSRTSAPAAPAPASPSAGLSPKEAEWEMPINAMNFCRFSLFTGDRDGKEGVGQDEQAEGLVAVVSLTKDEFVDVFHMPSQSRVHRSIGAGAWAVGEKTGSVMAVHLFSLLNSTSPASSPDAAKGDSRLHLLIAYESGQLALFRFTPTVRFESKAAGSGIGFEMPMKGRMVDEGEGWEMVWVEKGHRDAVMSFALSADKRFAYTVGADHFLCKYRVFDLNEEEAALPRVLCESTPSPGKAGIAVREDGKLLATAGWDGELRLNSAKTLSPLAVLSHHRTSLQAVAFSPLSSLNSSSPLRRTPLSSLVDAEGDDEEGSDNEEDGKEEEKGRGRKWLAAAGQEGKISLWEVYPPRASKV
ncbi:hypothetical protein JCM11641_006598 [Rhodosporidiobolus odoratus]